MAATCAAIRPRSHRTDHRGRLREQALPSRVRRGARRPGIPRHAHLGLRLRGRERNELWRCLPRARIRRQWLAHVRLGAGLARDERDREVRIRGAEAGVAAEDGGRRGDRMLRAHRARRRQRPRRHAHPRRARRRRLGDHRHQALDRTCEHRRRRGGLGDDRRRSAGLHRPDRHGGIHGDPDRRQARDAGVDPVRHHVR